MILAILPALLVTVLAFAFVSPGTAEQFTAHVTRYAPGESGAELHELLGRALDRRSAAWTLLAAGAASALWSSCSYLAVSRRALHAMHRVPDRRSTWRRAHRILVTALVLLVLLVVGALVLILGGPVAKSVGCVLHLDDSVSLVRTLVRWPLLLFLVAVLVVVLFRTGPPSARLRRHSLPGGTRAVHRRTRPSPPYRAVAGGPPRVNERADPCGVTKPGHAVSKNRRLEGARIECASRPGRP
ncbi:YhjD/YihY/BrkB family envelope integrity protein [Streptomyces sp. NPDC004285]